jgi:two-component system, NtrC family, response regulator HydG
MRETSGRRVLIVGDDAEGLEALRQLLGLWGFQADIGEDGKRALAVVRGRAPDAVVIDLGLAGATELIARIKAESGDTVVVAVSVWPQLEPAARVAGADWFVLKPDLKALERLLACLGRRASEPLVEAKKVDGKS